MSEPAFTKEEYKTFNALVKMTSSQNQLARITGRLELGAFVNKHGREKCDAMDAEFKRRSARTKEASSAKLEARRRVMTNRRRAV